MELKYIVYITINLCNGKFYIGVHETNPDVFDGYIGCGITGQNSANKNFLLHKAVKKYGYDNFKRTIIKIFPHTDEGKKQAYLLEQTLVNETLLRSKNCYNTALGGFGSVVEKTKKRIYMYSLNGEYLRSFDCSRSAARFLNLDNEDNVMHAIRNNCQGTINSCYGYYWSYKKEFNYKPNSKEQIIAQYTLSGKFLRTYKSIAEAEYLLGLNSIQQAITKKYRCGEYQWRYYIDNKDIAPLFNSYTRNKLLPIVMYDLNNNKVAEYESVHKCIEINTTLSASQINRVLKGIIKSHKGYIFKYKDEDIV